MIKPNELRIGNWFIGYDNKPFQFDYTDFMIIGQPTQWEQIPFDPDELIKSPIPLTEEVLLKCGFEKEKNVIPIYTLGLISIYWSIDDYPNGRLYFNSWCIHKYKPDHLHQLQNLYFALTGKELEIKL